MYGKDSERCWYLMLSPLSFQFKAKGRKRQEGRNWAGDGIWGHCILYVGFATGQGGQHQDSVALKEILSFPSYFFLAPKKVVVWEEGSGMSKTEVALICLPWHGLSPSSWFLHSQCWWPLTSAISSPLYCIQLCLTEGLMDYILQVRELSWWKQETNIKI